MAAARLDRPGWPLAVLVLTMILQTGPARATHDVDLAQLYAGLDPASLTMARHHVQQALETMPSRVTLRWAAGDGRATGLVTPLRTFKIRSGHYCREFVEAVTTGGDLRSEVQTACRDENGIWQRVKH